MRRAVPALLALALALLAGCRARLPWQPRVPGGFTIEGNTHVARDELIGAARRELEALETGEHREADAYDAAYAMERHLHANGYPEATVQFEIRGASTILRVDEGPRAVMGRVRFEGVTATSTATFEPYFEVAGSGFLGRGPRLYDETHVQGAVAKVESWYYAQGYARVEVGPPDATWNADRSAMDVLVPVREGRRYRIGRVVLEGAEARWLRPGEGEGRIFHSGVPAELASQVRQRMRDEGYAFAQVRPEVEIDDERAIVDVRLLAQQGEVVRLRRVAISGNERTSTGFMRRWIPLREGEVIRRSQLDAGLTALYRIGAFRTLDERLVPRGGDLADLEIQVEEADSRRVDFGLGWGSWELARGTVTYRDFNFTGHGRYLQASAVASVRHQGLDVLVEDPWLLGEDWVLSARAGGYRREERYYSYWSVNTDVYVERILPDGWRLRGGYRFDARDPFSVDSDIPADQQAEVEGFSRSAGLYVQARWDRRDHLFLPTRGWLTEARAFWSTPGLGANLDYVGIAAAGAWYLPLGSADVLGFGARFGTKVVLDDRPTLPIQERFFLGGSEDVRSFGQSELTPVDANGAGVGGLTALDATVEWRHRLVESLHAALFYDVGVVAVPSFSLDGAWGHGLGAGLRYYTPVGPVRLDVAWNPGPWWAASRPWQIHFGFGFSF